ncbi:NADH dehydrogenase [Capronia coronata CBS 617.96]|uniref:NADH dehydrogenase [ubiquinone] 1 alpha subcomplex subunit 13 n=1 Tax=Capronia coronata CBS 617.96 TaxID=1182541 RepID=W9YZF2_9EURO|nr:NADH dehydrogenase [Capronia coronata CBS 617.96]EXJ94681.1 NADH dehydrogenase [Capronia coronata CBS 617.96]
MAYGWRQVFVAQREKHEMAREKMWARIHLVPVMQAEEDRDQVRRYYADLAREKELLGSQSGAYNSNRYVILGDIDGNQSPKKLSEHWCCEEMDFTDLFGGWRPSPTWVANI